MVARRRALKGLGELKQGVREPTKQVHPDPFTFMNWPAVAAGSHVQPSAKQVCPDQVTRGGVVDLIEVLAASQERDQPRKVWCLAELHDQAIGAQCCDPVGFDNAHQASAQNVEAIFLRTLSHRGTYGEGSQVGVNPGDVDGADILDRHSVDRIDFRGQQWDETFIGQRDGEFVDDATGSLFEDFDRQHIATYRTDSTRDLTQGSWTIGHPDTDNDNDIHDENLSIELTRFVATRLLLCFASDSPRDGSLRPVLGDRA
jgi:hypothetical protein